jgi:cyclophilin family peptidyl-prolyl cis-trans isomerase
MYSNLPPPPRRETSGLAIASLVLAVLWLAGIGSILAIVFGVLAVSRTQRDPSLSGSGMAIAGIVLGAAGIVLPIAVIITVLAINGGASHESPSTNDSAASITTTVPSTRGTDTVPNVLYGTTPCPPVDGSAIRRTTFSSPFQKCIDPTKTYTATITTTMGVLVVDLDAKRTPGTVNNFVSLARSKFYDGGSCHRIIPDFVVQCGDPTGLGDGGPGYEFGDELPAPGSYKIGSVAMANAGPNTNGSQFFIVSGSLAVPLPPNYSLFGQVRAGNEAVLNALDAAGTDKNNGVPPKTPVGIASVTITER